MKKNLIALAVAGVLVAPLAAQAEVTVSGQLQAEVVSVSGDAAPVEGLLFMDGAEYAKEGAGNSGNLAFSASEDLGNGLKALAKYNFNVRADKSSVGRRDAYIGLSGGFGTVLLGTLSTPYKSSTVSWDPFLATFAQARGNFGMSGLHNGYADNVIAYANKFGPAKVVAAVALDEADTDAGVNDGDANGNHAMTFSVNVPVGPVEVAFAYIDVSEYTLTSDLYHADVGVNVPANTQLGEDATAMKVGVKYNAGPLTVAAQFEDLDEGLGDYSSYYLTGSYAMGANTISASYGANDIDNVEGNYMAIGVKHAFSKNTSLMAAYRASDTDIDNTDENAVGVSMRVKF